MFDRVLFTRNYVVALKRSHDSDWLTQYRSYRDGELSVCEIMALLHPDHYLHLPGRFDPRGPRAFGFAAANPTCQSSVIWGYECPLPHSVPRAADHMFPYCLGGATVADNRITLCEWHNRLKGSDVHLYPWEFPLGSWVGGLLQNIAALMELIETRGA